MQPYILVKYASRGRSDRFLAGLENIYELCYDPEQIRVMVTADIDDKTMCNTTMRDKIRSFPNAEVIYGTSEGKIHAINRDMDILPDYMKDWSVVANFSDDMRWFYKGWDQQIMIDFQQHSPDFSHFMAYLDPDTKGMLSTLYIAGRSFYDRFGFIYDPAFKSLWCDMWVEKVAAHIGKFHYENNTIYIHKNPAYNYADFPRDTMFDEQQALWNIDEAVYNELLAKGVDEYMKQFNP